jgi:hypothetical protein
MTLNLQKNRYLLLKKHIEISYNSRTFFKKNDDRLFGTYWISLSINRIRER